MKKKIVKWIILLIVLMSMGSTPVKAGDGTYNVGTPDTITLNVVFEFDLGNNFNHNATWEGVFTRASELLFNSTDGQIQIGTVNFYNNCPEALDQADVVVHSGSGGASAHVSGFGVRGQHINIYNDTHSQNQANARGHFGVVHELGHYLFGLYDSYIDSRGNSSSCINDASTVASIMDGGTTVQPNNQRTEWALAADEATCKNTAQYEIRNMVDWPWIVQYMQNEHSAALTQPAAYDTAMPAGHQALTFNYHECKLRAVVCLDRSGSMASEDKIATARDGATLFTDLTKASDELGISSFSTTANIEYSIATMNDANKRDAKNAISALFPDDQTDIGGGLQTSLNMITGQGDAVSNEVVILLSDGQHNTGTNPISVIPALKARGVVVYTIGLGSDADASLMSQIANETGGNYFYAADASSLVSHFNSIFTQMRNDGAIANLSEDLGAGQTRAQSAEIDAYTSAGGEVTFVLTWGGGDADFTLKRPNGSIVADGDADVTYFVRGANSILYRMNRPATGRWDMVVASGASPIAYNLQVNSTSKSNVFVIAATDKGLYLYGEPIIVSTSVMAPPRGALEGLAVSGATATGTVKLDGVAIDAIALYDDGDRAHGDAKKNDGVYSNLYNPAKSGNHTFEITVNNVNGQTAPPDEEYPSWSPLPIDPFIRISEITVVVDLSSAPPAPPQLPPQQPPADIPPIISPPQTRPGGGGGAGLAFVIAILLVAGVGIYASTQRKRMGKRPAAAVMGASLYCIAGPLAGRRVMLNQDFLIGRNRSCNFQINDRAVSRYHARIRFSQGAWFIQDQNSSGGTFVNGQRTSAAILRAGNQIQIGQNTFLFEQK
jgi:Mg-chelatase subunit ChlD